MALDQHTLPDLLVTNHVDISIYVPPSLLSDLDAAKPVVVLAGLHGGCYEQHTPRSERNWRPPGSSTADSGPRFELFGNKGIDRRYAYMAYRIRLVILLHTGYGASMRFNTTSTSSLDEQLCPIYADTVTSYPLHIDTSKIPRLFTGYARRAAGVAGRKGCLFCLCVPAGPLSCLPSTSPALFYLRDTRLFGPAPIRSLGRPYDDQLLTIGRDE